MKISPSIFFLQAVLCALLLWAQPARAVDDGRLLAAGRDADNWLTYGHGFANQRYSPLKEIDRANVGHLVPKWIFQTGIQGTFQANPLVADGRMYLSTPYNHVVALDAATGEPLWRYEHELRTDKLCCGPANRGLALGYGRIYMITVDARLIALKMDDGSVAWEVPVADPNSGTAESVADLLDSDVLKSGDVTGWTGFGGNMAPLVHDGKVIVGVTGAGYGLHLAGSQDNPVSVVGFSGKQHGLRAFLSAFDAATGKVVWRWYATAADGWEGQFVSRTAAGDPLYRDTAKEREALARYNDAWRRGGGSLWTHPALDAEAGLLYVGTGNPAPQLDGESRPGDNLYTVSLVALEVATGKLRWFHQQVPHDQWGYDVASPPVLFDLQHNGSTVPALSQAGKTGWLYVHDRRSGELLGRSEPFVPQSNLFRPPTREGVVIAPGAAGGSNWSPTSYNPLTGWVYVAAIHMPTRYTVHDVPAEKQSDSGASTYTSVTGTGGESWGVLSAIDPATGKIRWSYKTSQPLVGGVATTAGGLLFVGEGNGLFAAHDIETGERLWQFRTGAGVNAPPVTYRAGGRQYVAVAAGGHQLFRFPGGDAVIAFGLAD